MSNESHIERFFMTGSCACAEGAIAAGCRFFASHPVSSSLGMAEHMSRRLPRVRGHYLQMEDEIGGLAATLGASIAGLKSMTVIAGQGLSLMMEHGASGMITETPCVLVDLQHGGSVGRPTFTGGPVATQPEHESDDKNEMIAYAPSSVQEMFDLTVKAFNMAETYRMPTFVVADQTVIRMTDRLAIPQPEMIKVVERKKLIGKHSNPLAIDFNPAQQRMPLVFEVNKANINSPTPNERECSQASQDFLEKRLKNLVDRVRSHLHEIVEVEHYHTDDAKVVVVAYGATSRSALSAVKEARDAGRKVGLLRLITPSPFPAEEIEHLNARRIVVPETDGGQIGRSVRAHSSCSVVEIHHGAESLILPSEIYAALKRE
jgi:2-oxoglutarate/2-oxoacid ferredoxin oxidoreductase subunit alpha